ncbi:LysR family transcriptional regulator [Aestuariivita sp.]|jgi:DNA-binding transcriptional LysR family regulator|uniref:LysR family transcriptional regulator n=1 Tax=Aestuariivita sp. TaxID=1872407 RepID=UPI00217328D4|nr:LysR family transcriptional regulator [Aestuariivita sp.]MCE8009834.1 LysR family transcriptional regulator [Aestuariivita sp.]
MIKIDSRHARAFLLSCQKGTIRAAAETLGLEASSVSRQITELETQLGLMLMERSRRGVRATQAGQLLLAHLRQQQADFEALEADFDALRGMRRGEISIAIGDGFISDFLGNALPGFRAAMPGLTYKLESGSTEKVIQSVHDDTAHFGFAFNAQPDTSLRVLFKARQPLAVLASPNSDLARSDAPLSMPQLAALPMALPLPNFGIGVLLRETEAVYGVRLQAVLEANSIAALRNFVREEMGVTILPAFVVAREIADGLIVARSLDVPELNKGEAALLTRHGRRLPESALRLANHAARSMLAFQNTL